MTDLIVAEGHAVKALDDSGRVGGYLVRFGTPDDPDLTGDYFTPDTDFDVDEWPAKARVYYHHGLDPTLKRRRLATGDMRQDGVGVWVEAQLSLRDEYEQAVFDLAKAGKLGWSSGTAPHLVDREPGAKAQRIARWPLGLDASLTPTPAEYRNEAFSLKSLIESSVPETRPEAEAATSAASVVDVGESIPHVTQEVEAMDTEVKAAPDTDVGAEIKALRAELDALKSAPAVNPPAVALAPVLVHGRNDDPVKAFTHYLRTGDEGAVKAYNNTDMNVTTAADGGYAVPTPLYDQIIAKRDETSILPALGLRMIPGKGLTVRVPIDNEDDVVFASVAEAGSVTQDAPALSYKDFTLVKYGKHITLSWELLRDEDANLMAFVNDWIGRGVAATENSVIMTELRASGTAGLTLDAATAIGYTEIPEMVGKLAPEYQAGAKWILAPSTIAYIQGVANAASFLFSPGPMSYAGQPSLWGYPVVNTTQASAIGASAKSLVFGNYNFVGYRRATSINMLRDPYTAATTGQVKLWFWFDFVVGVMQAEAVQYATHPSA